MAKRTKTSSKSGGSQKSRSLVYEESYFKNRNDMLQSSLDSVYQRIDAEALAYEARLKATKDLTRALDKELQRLRKMRDDLDVRQLDKNAAAQQWSAGQRNAAQRTEFLVTASNSRFLADKAFDRATYGSGTSTKAVGIPGLDETIMNEADRNQALYPDDPNAALADFRAKIAGVGEFAKSAQQIDLATAYRVDGLVTNELIKLDRGEGNPDQVAVYQQFAGDAKAQRGIAVQAVLDKITDPAVVASANRGYQTAEELSKRKGAGISDDELGKMVATGRIPVESVGPPNYDSIKAGLDTRIAKLEGDIKGITPEAPVPLSERNIIEEQRDEYFRTFYPSATPAYQTNRLMQSILSGNLDPQSEAIIMDILSAERKAARMPAEGPLGPEIENAGAIRGFSGKQGARMPGDIIYGEGSPFVPEDRPLSDKALKILSNKGANQFFGEGLSDDEIQKRANDLLPLGLGLTKVTKEDGKVLYTVVPFDRLGQFNPGDVVMPQRQTPTSTLSLDGSEQFLLDAPEEDMRIAQENVAVRQGQPLAATLLQAYDTAQAAVKEAAASGDKAKIQAAAKQAADINVELDKALMELGQTRQDIEIEPRRLQPITGDRAEVRRILNDPERQRYKAPFKITAPGSDQPPAGPAIRRPSGISIDPVSPDVQPTADGKDASFKINALESAAKLVDNDELGRMLKTPVGSAIEQLYKANKAKGNQTDKELLGYIAKEFPKVDDQKTAATALFGLSYQDELSGKLG